MSYLSTFSVTVFTVLFRVPTSLEKSGNLSSDFSGPGDAEKA